ncbi:MAG: Abi family protein [Treponema sp.]|nr:Abi family protein [Treponema sp.]
MKPKYDKPALTPGEQAELLFSRGLKGIETDELIKTLSFVSYYRLRGYMYPYQDNSIPSTPFLNGTSWEYIKNDYLFDQQFRHLIFSAVENIEIAMRTQLTLQMSLTYGSRWYTDKKLFVKENLWAKDRENLQKEWQRSKEVFTGHYNSCYDTTYDPPSWMIFETASFGTLSKYFENIDYTLPARNRITGFWGFPEKSGIVVSSWFRHLSFVRNICAHYGRLFSRELIVTPVFPKYPPEKWVSKWYNPNRVYTTVCILTCLLDYCAPDYDFRTMLSGLMHTIRSEQLPAMGFPENWQQEPLFKGEHTI